jgi:predicted XRE-type DNA-binding protein
MSPEVATIHALRAALALQIARHVRRSGRTQVDAAARLGIPQPTLSKIVNGQVDALSIELLLRVTIRAELPVVVQTGREPAEAGVFVRGTPNPGRRPRSPLGEASRQAVADAAIDLSAEQRLEAQLQHSQLLVELQRAARALQPQRRRVYGIRSR